MSTLFTALLLFSVTLVYAQNNTVDLLLPADDPQNLYASIISADAAKTIFRVECSLKADFTPDASVSASASATTSARRNRFVKRQDDEEETATATATGRGGGDSHTECPFPTPLTITQGAKTLHFDYSFGKAKQIVDCKLAGTTQAVCTGTASGSGVSTGTTTATLRGDNLPTAIAVEVTAGAEKTKNIKTSSSSTSGSSTSSEATSGTSAEASTTATEQPSSTSAAPAATTSDASALFEPALGLVIAMLLAVVAATFM